MSKQQDSATYVAYVTYGAAALLAVSLALLVMNSGIVVLKAACFALVLAVQVFGAFHLLPEVMRFRLHDWSLMLVLFVSASVINGLAIYSVQPTHNLIAAFSCGMFATLHMFGAALIRSRRIEPSSD